MSFQIVPGDPRSTVIIHVPHSSREIPVPVWAEIIPDDDELDHELDAMTDAYTDLLADHAADASELRPWLFVNRLSRLVVDPERFPVDREEMKAVGMGAVYTRTSCAPPRLRVSPVSEPTTRLLVESPPTERRSAVLPVEVRRRIDAIWDKIWASGVSNPLTAIEYFSTVLLLCRLSERHRNEADAACWSDLIASIDDGDVGAVVRIMLGVQESYGIGASPDVASLSTWRDLATLREVIRDVRNLEFSDRNHDILGDLFEYMLDHLSTAGHFGQFRTPRHLIKFLVEAVEPKSGETVLDPACGTAGFLIAAHEFRGGESERYVGNEVDATMARVAETNTKLHAMDGASIEHGDSLQIETRDADVILANPPFAGAVVADRVSGFESGTLKTELLFIELMMRRLKAKGRAGVVVPTGVLTSSASAAVWIRRQLVESNRLRAVVELPGGVFRPYTGVKTGLLLWSNEPSADEVLMIRISNDGYSLDDRREPVDGDELASALELLRGGTSPVAHAPVSTAHIASEKYNLSPSRYIAGDEAGDFGLRELNLGSAVLAARDSMDELANELLRLEGLTR